MAWTKVLVFDCDASYLVDGHKSICGQSAESDERSIGNARRVLAKDGWVYKDGLDLCPRHNKEWELISAAI